MGNGGGRSGRVSTGLLTYLVRRFLLSAAQKKKKTREREGEKIEEKKGRILRFNDRSIVLEVEVSRTSLSDN